MASLAILALVFNLSIQRAESFMKKLSLALVLSSVAILGLAACDTMPDSTHIETKNGHYWQRTDASSAIYQRGPKAQQMLHRDIAKCVYEVKELQRLGSIRSNIPADATLNGGPIPDPNTAAGRLASQDTPERDGYLYAEQTDFHDFETCMKTAGWDRVEYLPYTQSTEARAEYIENMKSQRRRTASGDRDETAAAPEKPFSNLNN